MTLEDFNAEQIADLNQRYGGPLRDASEMARFMELVNGHPFLVRRGLYELATANTPFDTFMAEADRDDGNFEEHLRHLYDALRKDSTLQEVVRNVLRGHCTIDAKASIACAAPGSFPVNRRRPPACAAISMRIT